MFCDFIDFTGISTQLSPELLIGELTDIYGHFDELCEKQGVTRIKTIGDSYMAATGLNADSEDHARKLVNVAFDFISYLSERNTHTAQVWKCRIGINSGSVIAGIIGKTRFVYDIIGADVNIAARVETAGVNMAVTITDATRQLLGKDYFIQSIGMTQLKGAGEMELFVVEKIRQ